jgi:hypothetical protein
MALDLMLANVQFGLHEGLIVDHVGRVGPMEGFPRHVEVRRAIQRHGPPPRSPSLSGLTDEQRLEHPSSRSVQRGAVRWSGRMCWDGQMEAKVVSLNSVQEMKALEVVQSGEPGKGRKGESMPMPWGVRLRLNSTRAERGEWEKNDQGTMGQWDNGAMEG